MTVIIRILQAATMRKTDIVGIFTSVGVLADSLPGQPTIAEPNVYINIARN